MMSMTALELRKNRLVFIGLAAAFALSLPLGALIGKRSLFSAMTGVHAALAFWCTLGLPALAVLLGAAAGAGLRSEPEASAEAPLPVSPPARVFAAWSSSLLHMALLAGLVLSIAFILGPRLSADKDWGRFSWELFESFRLYLSLLAFTLLLTLSAGLLFAYLFGHGVLGGLLAVGLGAAAAAAVGAAFILRLFFPNSVGWDLLPEAGMLAAISLVLAAIRSAAPAVELRPVRAWAASALSGMLAAAAVAACALAFLHMLERVVHAGRIIEPEFLGDWSGMGEDGPRARGVFLTDREGSVAWVTQDGSERVLVRGEERKLRHLLDRPFWFPIRSAAWTPDGDLWVLRKAGLGPTERWELLRGKSGQEIKRILALPEGHMDLILDWRDAQTVLTGTVYGQPDGKWGYRYARIPATGGQVRWEPVPAVRGAAGVRGSEPPLARLNSDLRALSRKWGIPDSSRRPLSPLKLGSQGGTLTSVLLKDGSRALAEHRKDGTLRQHWRGHVEKDFAPWTLPDGTRWAWGAKENLLILPREGTPLEPVPLEKTLAGLRSEGPGLWRKPWVIRRESGRLWLLAGVALLQIEESSGSLLKRVDLPTRKLDVRDDRSGFHVAADGVFYHDGRSLHFMDWEGRLKRLRRA